MIKEGLRRYFDVHGNVQLRILPSVFLCRLFFFQVKCDFFFPAGTCSSAPRTTGSVSLCRGRSRGPGLLTGHPQSMESQALWPGANDPPSRRSCAVIAGKRAGRGPQRAFRWGSSREQRPGPPSFTAGVLAARPSGCSAR